MEKIVFVTQTLGHKHACGIGLIGKLLGESLVKSKKYDFEVLYTDSAKELEEKILEKNPSVIIYNFHPHTTPWVQNREIRDRYPTILHIMLHHDIHQEFIDCYHPDNHFGFKYVITADPTLKESEHVFLVNRLIPPFQPKPYVDLGIPVIGFQGFGPPHKGIHKIAEKVQEEFDEAIIRLHIPFSFYGDPQGNEARKRVAEVQNIIEKPGIQIEASHKLLSTEKIVEFLGANTINCYFYDYLPGAGLASSPDYALAARRPIAVTKSYQLRNYIGLKPSICIEENSLKDILSFGTKPLECLYESYTEENVIRDYERVIDRLLDRKKTTKPRLAIVSSHNICCALAYYADALKSFLSAAFDVKIVDLKSSQLLRQEGENYQRMSEAHIEQLCSTLREFDLVNVHLELGLYGTTTKTILSRVLKICQASGRLILTIHTIDYKGPSQGHAHVYQQIMQSLKERPASNPFHLITHLHEEKLLIEKVYGFKNVHDFPLIFLTDKRRRHFKKLSNPYIWKKQFGFHENDITIGMFGLLSPHKNYLHALQTIRILPKHYKLLVIGEAHHMSIKEGQVDPVIQQMVAYLDNHPELVDRVVFTGRRDDETYYEDLANIDFVLLPSFEAGQSGSATLSTGLELSCAILKSNTSNTRGYETYFPNCFEVFDIGNYYETRNKILNFDKNKLYNLTKKSQHFSEVQLRQIYLQIYGFMQAATPIDLVKRPISVESFFPPHAARPVLIRALIRLIPKPTRSFIKRFLKKVQAYAN